MFIWPQTAFVGIDVHLWFWYFGGGPSFRGPVRGAVNFPYTGLCKSCYRISSIAKYHRDPIMVLYCRPHSQVYACASLVQSKFQGGGGQKGQSWKFIPSPHKIGSGKLVRDQKILLDKPNALEWSKRMYEKVLLLSVPFRSKHFYAFWHFLSF